MANHGWQKGQWRAEKGPLCGRKSLLDLNRASKTSIHDDWQSPPEYFNERGLGPDVAASRSLKFLKNDCISAQVAPSRAEKLPISNVDVSLYRKSSRQSPQYDKDKNIFSKLEPAHRRRSSRAAGHRSSGSHGNASHAQSKTSFSSFRSLTPVLSGRLPDFVSVQQLPERGASYHGTARAASPTDLRGPSYSHSDKALLGSLNSKRYSQSDRNISILSSTNSILRGKRKSSGDTPSLSYAKLRNQENGMLEGSLSGSKSSTLDNSAFLVTRESPSFRKVVWSSTPTPEKPVMRRAPSGISLLGKNTNSGIALPYPEIKRRESNVASDRSKASNRSVVWSRLPKLLHNHPAVPDSRISRVSHSKLNANLSFDGSRYTQSFNRNSGGNADRIYKKMYHISFKQRSDSKWVNSLRGGNGFQQKPKPHRTGGASSLTSGIVDVPLTDNLRSASASYSSSTIGASSIMKGCNSTVKPHVTSNTRKTQRAVGMNGILTKRLSKTEANSADQHCIRRSISDLSKEFEHPVGSESRVLPSEIRTLDVHPFATSSSSSQKKVEGGHLKNMKKVDKYSSNRHVNQVNVKRMVDLLPLKRTVYIAGACAETKAPAFSRRIIRTGNTLEDRTRAIRNIKKKEVKINDHASLELLRPIHLSASGTRGHCLPVQSNGPPCISPSQLSSRYTSKIKLYLEQSGLNTKESRKENTGKKAKRIQSLIKSKDPFSYLLGYHGFWGERNYY